MTLLQQHQEISNQNHIMIRRTGIRYLELIRDLRFRVYYYFALQHDDESKSADICLKTKGIYLAISHWYWYTCIESHQLPLNFPIYVKSLKSLPKSFLLLRSFSKSDLLLFNQETLH